MRSNRNDLTIFQLAAVAISLLLGYGGFPAAAAVSGSERTIEVKKSYTTYNPKEDVSAIFEETLEQDGITYQLQDIESQIISFEPEIEEKIISIVTEPVYDETELENIRPEETSVQNEITYYLVSSEVINGTTEERTEYGKNSMTYFDVEYVDQVPETGKVTVTDSVTGKEYVKSLPLSEYTVTAEHWKDDFTFPVTIYSVDADYYMLGDLVILRGSDLVQYGSELISYLGLDRDSYKVNSIMLLGEPFEQDDELVQEAAACGSRRTADVTATYEGNVLIPPEAFHFYRCIYSNIDPHKVSGMSYEMVATATYQLKENENEAINRMSDMWYETALFSILLIPVIGLAMILILVRKGIKTGTYSNN